MKLQREVNAVQFVFGQPLPEGMFEVLPEVTWSAGRKYVYFSYGDVGPGMHGHWMTTEKLKEKPGDGDGIFGGYVSFTMNDTGEVYYREWLNFAFISIKSEDSLLLSQGTHNPPTIYVDGTDKDLLELWWDYASASKFPNPLPRMAEFREMSGAYGRGFRPHYLHDGDWLLDDNVPKYSNDSKYRVVSTEQLNEMKVA